MTRLEWNIARTEWRAPPRALPLALCWAIWFGLSAALWSLLLRLA